jgi:membrane protease YdiL (CAAX protease family)
MSPADAPRRAEPLRPIVPPDAARDFWSVVILCAVACVGLGIVKFLGDESTYRALFPPRSTPVDPEWVLASKAWWIGWILVGYAALPAGVMRLWPGGRLADCHLSWRGFRDHVWIYVALYAAMFPLLYAVSWVPGFLAYYPMYAAAGRSWADLLLWESLYAGQFVGLEFFFRGFLVGGLSRYIGILAVPVSVLPYLMIHFTKLWPEASASIVAGFVLGWLAWKTKSIWGGVCVHCAVAMSMDLLALAHKGQLPWMHH